jgi:hypothetical protein
MKHKKPVEQQIVGEFGRAPWKKFEPFLQNDSDFSIFYLK